MSEQNNPFAPVHLLDLTADGFGYSVSFYNWEYVFKNLKIGEELLGVYLNGYSMTGIWRAEAKRLDWNPDLVEWDSEADGAVAFTKNKAHAEHLAGIGRDMMASAETLTAACKLAIDSGEMKEWD